MWHSFPFLQFEDDEFFPDPFHGPDFLRRKTEKIPSSTLVIASGEETSDKHHDFAQQGVSKQFSSGDTYVVQLQSKKKRGNGPRRLGFFIPGNWGLDEKCYHATE